MKLLKLADSTQVALVDDDRFEALSRFRWKLNERGIYAQWRDNGVRRTVMLHHAVIGKPRAGLETDHRDRNRLNNQRSNLRQCTHGQNMQNRGGWSKTGFKGIYRDKRQPIKPWIAELNLGRAKFKSKSFGTPEEAALAYNELAKAHFGEFAVLNTV